MEFLLIVGVLMAVALAAYLWKGSNSKSSNSAEGSSNSASGARYKESDNLGTRHDTFQQAVAWWMSMMTTDKGAYLVYTFPNESSARKALLATPVVHEADRSKKLIATKPVVFGYYRRDDGVWEAELVGKSLTTDLWNAARDAFRSNGGTRKNERSLDD